MVESDVPARVNGCSPTVWLKGYANSSALLRFSRAETLLTHISLNNWYHAEDRHAHPVELGRAAHRTIQQLDKQRQEKTEPEPSGSAREDEQRTIGPFRLIGKVGRIDERQPLSTLLVGQPSPALCLEQVAATRLVLLTKIACLAFQLHHCCRTAGPRACPAHR